MSHYHSSAIISIIIIITLLPVISLTFARTIPSSSSLKERFGPRKNETSFNLQQRLSAHTDKIHDFSTSLQDRLKPSDEASPQTADYHADASLADQTASVVVLTSLSGIYIWWPVLFGGDDSFHLLLSQEDVPRFHDVIGDEHGHIYLTAPHERTVYRLLYTDGWWTSNFSNHSLMNSIRGEMPLFVNIHHVSSILYVYGHSDIQTIDLLHRPRTRGSAPFMKRLRELSPNLRISDFIIDQLTSDGYIVGDSYGWCTIIRCSLSVNECGFLFKIPSSYDNRPYPCTATIDFSSKIMYLSLEEKILGVHLNEQTNYDRRFVLTEKRGPRSTLGYDDIVTYNNTILYTDVLRPLLHICTSISTNPCLNISLNFPSSQRTILPLRLTVIQAPHFRAPTFDDEDEGDLSLNETDSHLTPSSLLALNQTADLQSLVADITTVKPLQRQIGNIWMLLLGVCTGLLLAGLAFMVYYITFNKNRPHMKKPANSSSTRAIVRAQTPSSSPESSDHRSKSSSRTRSSNTSSSDSTQNRLLDHHTYTTTNGSYEWPSAATSSSSYRPDTVL